MKRRATKAGRAADPLLADIAVVITAAAFVATGAVLLWISTLDMPDLSAFEERRVLQSTKIYDRTGEVLLYDLHQDVRRTSVGYEDISRHIKNATVAIEDDTFFEHHGVRPLAIVRAAIANLQEGDLFGGQGGSTITQQVIKNALLEPEKRLTRKIKEIILAFRLEQTLSKEEILLHYLNESPYGGTIYGVEEASRAYFGISAADVTLAQAAYLAALPQAPTFYSPHGNNVAALEARKNRVLTRMRALGFITDQEYQNARAEEVVFLPQATSGIRAPHFVFYVRDYLARRYGEEFLAERGFRVITSLDWQLQEAAERIVRERALANETQFNAENAGLAAIEPQTGQVLVMVGSRNYFDPDIDGNVNVTLAERQPGSAFKPFVYAAALERGYTPETAVFDLHTQFSTTCEIDHFSSEGDCYAPNNYDGQFRGPVNFRNALAQSLNVPAVKVLYLAGMEAVLKVARDFGITTFGEASRYGLSLVLGGGEVRLLELVGAYGVFANEGVRAQTMSILRIEDAEGQVIETFTPRSQRVIDRNVALQISDMLSDDDARAPLYGPNSLLDVAGYDVAVKTGTTNDYRDAWIVGYTPTIAVGAWAGNNDNRSMERQLSGLIITPLWREFLDVALQTRPRETFRAAPATPPQVKPVLRGVWFSPEEILSEGEVLPEVAGALSAAHSILYFVDRNDPEGPPPRTPEADPQFTRWEYPVSLWKAAMLAGIEGTQRR